MQSSLFRRHPANLRARSQSATFIIPIGQGLFLSAPTKAFDAAAAAHCSVHNNSPAASFVSLSPPITGGDVASKMARLLVTYFSVSHAFL